MKELKASLCEKRRFGFFIRIIILNFVPIMQKFVITLDGELRFGDVHLHKDLLPYGVNDCFGGGLWKINAGGMSIDLYGCSFDFGPADFNQVRTINYSGVGGKPLPLIYYPFYPSLDNAEPVFAQTEKFL